MQKFCTFLSVIEDNFFFGFEKKIKSLIYNLNSIGYQSDYYNINDLSYKGFLKLYKYIRSSKAKNIIIRTIGIKTFILLIFVLLAKKNKIIYLEVPTSFSTLSFEFKNNNKKKIINYIYYYLNLFLTPFLLIFFKRIIYYDTEKFPYNYFIKSKIFQWQNGVDVNSINFHNKINKIDNYFVNFVCVGSLSKWHGLERLIDSILHYQKNNNNYKFNINLVGFIDEQVENNIKDNKKYFDNGNKINFLGLKKDVELYDIFKKSNIGIGSLGLKNINSFERSELKIREYTAAGLPFIMEADDRDFYEDKLFFYRINKNEYYIDIEKLILWFNNLTMRVPEEMRNFAINKLDHKVKIKQLINEIF